MRVEETSMRSRESRYVKILLVLLLGVCSCAPSADQEPVTGEWHYFGSDQAFTRYSPLDQIDRDNVHQLEILWV